MRYTPRQILEQLARLGLSPANIDGRGTAVSDATAQQLEVLMRCN